MRNTPDVASGYFPIEMKIYLFISKLNDCSVLSVSISVRTAGLLSADIREKRELSCRLLGAGPGWRGEKVT